MQSQSVIKKSRILIISSQTASKCNKEDQKKINIYNKSGGNYSATSINFDDLKSRDGTFYKAPKNVIFELKFPNADIRGVAK